MTTMASGQLGHPGQQRETCGHPQQQGQQVRQLPDELAEQPLPGGLGHLVGAVSGQQLPGLGAAEPDLHDLRLFRGHAGSDAEPSTKGYWPCMTPTRSRVKLGNTVAVLAVNREATTSARTLR